MASGVRSKSLIITVVICGTLVLISLIGAWVYVQNQQIAQRDRQLQSEKELKEYEQQQINEREKAKRDAEAKENFADRLFSR